MKNDHSKKIKEGIALAKKHGRQVGRPSKQIIVKEDVLRLEKEGLATCDIAEQVGVSPSTIHRILRKERERKARGC